ncbi:MAG: c-type cytochrome [Planctomycetes bacterium]|nr:c-type cytochrome [Planctomycetota bacterium]
MKHLRNLTRIVVLAVLGMLSLQPGALGQMPPAEMSDDPEVFRKLTQLPDGFEIQLVAAEPTIINPVQINFDARGRLWVLCAPRYPQILPGQAPKDYVVVLEDFDPAGKAKKSTVFVEGLTVPTGMMPGDGGVYVGQGETLLHFSDPGKTGKATKRKVVFAGFGTSDTHHTLNTFRWGPDGALYFNQGVYILSTVETPYGPRKLFGGCIWQLRTDRLKLEVFDRSILPNNTWGHAFDAMGQSFIASAWPGALNRILPDSPLHRETDQEAVPNLKMTQIGGERHCGLEIVSGRHFPEDWQGNLLTGDFLSHKIYRYRLEDDGQQFVSKLLPPLVVSRHRKFRPIDIKMGPDGAVYIADLYQQIIQHNQIDFRDPRRDHTCGRIWRVVRKDRPLLANPNLADLPLPRLLDHLKDPEQWTRLQVKRLLAEGDRQAAGKALGQWVSGIDAKDPQRLRHLLEALWAYQSIDQVEARLLEQLLQSDDARIRAAATRVIAAWHERLPEPTRLLARQARDASPRVRLEAAMAAGHIPSARALDAALSLLDQPMDPLLDFALRRTIILLKPGWFPDFQNGKLVLHDSARHLPFALQAIKAPGAIAALRDLFVARRIPASNRAEVLRLLASLGDENDLNLIAKELIGLAPLPARDQARILDELANAAGVNRPKSVPAAMPWLTLFASADRDVAASAVRVAGLWKQEHLRAELTRITASDSPKLRVAAVEALVDLGGVRSVEFLTRQADSKLPAENRLEAVIGLARLDLAKATPRAAELLRGPPQPEVVFERLFTTFLGRKGGPAALTAAFSENTPSKESAKLGLRVLAGLGTPAPTLNEALQAAAGFRGIVRKLSAEETKQILHLARTKGNPDRGEAVFRRPVLGCFQCHALGGAGGNVGPDLSGIGTSAPMEYLLESVVLPAKTIREGYTTATIFTVSGQLLTGVLVRESPKELVLREPTRPDEIVIKKKDIEEKKIGGSLMPNGLDQSLSDEELADLVRFLSELGKPGPFGVTHEPVARRWQKLDAAPEKWKNQDAESLGKTLRDGKGLTWSTVYARVRGDLPLKDLVTAGNSVSVLRTQLQVAAPGKIALRLAKIPTLKLWVDDRPVAVSEKIELDLDRGLHSLTLWLDRPEPTMELRLALVEVAGSTAAARFVHGR